MITERFGVGLGFGVASGSRYWNSRRFGSLGLQGRNAVVVPSNPIDLTRPRKTPRLPGPRALADLHRELAFGEADDAAFDNAAVLEA
ncbi:MAG: hypothetical protein IPK58_24180 [Acidobacteria bacterium]|nr:hypothetical protein [Acidobacteriota bacterium]